MATVSTPGPARTSARCAARSSPSTTRPGSRTSSAACTTPASSSCPRVDCRADRLRRRAGGPGGGAHRVPRVPGGPGQDAAPAGARRHPGRHPQARPPRAARRARGSRRSSSSSSTSTRSRHRRVGCDAGRVRRADRHRRAVDGAGRGQEPPERGRRHRPRPATTRSLEAVRSGGFTLAGAAAGWRPRHSSTRPRTTSHVASWMGNVYTDDRRAPASRPGSAAPGSAPRCSATARTRTSGPRSTRNGSQPAAGLAQAEQLHGKEMSYNNYVDADAAWRAAYDHGASPPSPIIKHANPCGIAVGRTSPRRTAGRTPATRCRRSAGSSPPTAR